MFLKRRKLNGESFTSSSGGNVSGPTTTTDNAIVSFDGTTGDIKDSNFLIPQYDTPVPGWGVLKTGNSTVSTTFINFQNSSNSDFYIGTDGSTFHIFGINPERKVFEYNKSSSTVQCGNSNLSLTCSGSDITLYSISGINLEGTTVSSNAQTFITSSNNPVRGDPFGVTGALEVTGGIRCGNSLIVDGDLVLDNSPIVPIQPTDAGAVGTVKWDGDYLYVCVAANTWKRVGLSTW